MVAGCRIHGWCAGCISCTRGIVDPLVRLRGRSCLNLGKENGKEVFLHFVMRSIADKILCGLLVTQTFDQSVLT